MNATPTPTPTGPRPLRLVWNHNITLACRGVDLLGDLDLTEAIDLAEADDLHTREWYDALEYANGRTIPVVASPREEWLILVDGDGDRRLIVSPAELFAWDLIHRHEVPPYPAAYHLDYDPHSCWPSKVGPLIFPETDACMYWGFGYNSTDVEEFLIDLRKRGNQGDAEGFGWMTDEPIAVIADNSDEESDHSLAIYDLGWGALVLTVDTLASVWMISAWLASD